MRRYSPEATRHGSVAHVANGGRRAPRDTVSMAREYAESTGRTRAPIERFARAIGARVIDGCGILAVDQTGKAARHREHVHGPSEAVSVTCWCEASIVTVPLGEVRAGRTGSCGRNGCIPHRHAVELGPTLGGRREH